jgi:hypothetical protein
MKKLFCIFVLYFSFFALYNFSLAAKYAGEFLNLGAGGKALGMGGAYVAYCDDGTAGYWNPAGLSQIREKRVFFMHSETFGSLLNYDFLSYSLPFAFKRENTVLGFSLLRLGGGGIKLTSVPDTSEPISQTNRAYVVKEAEHADYAFLFSLAQKTKSKFSYGFSAKIIYRHLAQNSAFGMGADLGVLYQLFPYLTLGATLWDASTTFLAYDTGNKESIYPTLKSGIKLQKKFRDFYLVYCLDGDIRAEGRKFSAQYWLGNFSLDMHYGMEVSYQEKIAGRLGWDQGNFTAGTGVSIKRFGIDVAFLNHSELKDSYRISLQIKL